MRLWQFAVLCVLIVAVSIGTTVWQTQALEVYSRAALTNQATFVGNQAQFCAHFGLRCRTDVATVRNR